MTHPGSGLFVLAFGGAPVRHHSMARAAPNSKLTACDLCAARLSTTPSAQSRCTVGLRETTALSASPVDINWAAFNAVGNEGKDGIETGYDPDGRAAHPDVRVFPWNFFRAARRPSLHYRQDRAAAARAREVGLRLEGRAGPIGIVDSR